MNKKLISFAVAGILAGGVSAVSASNVTVYGKVQVSIDNHDLDVSDNDGFSASEDDINLSSIPNYSAIGVKGSEDLGNGLTAMFQLEYGAEPANAGGLAGRDQWAGLKGDFGTVRFGAMSTNYKQSGAAIDPFWRTSLDSRQPSVELDEDTISAGLISQLHSGKGANGQGRATSTVRYDSPSFNGAKIVANYSFDQAKGDVEDDDTWGVGVHYSQGPIFAAFDYITNGVGGDDDAWKLSGKYNMDALSFYGTYERGGLLFADLGSLTRTQAAFEGLYGAGATASDTNGDSSDNVWHLAGSYSMGATMLYAAYGQAEGWDGMVEYDTWTIGVNHSMSKRTSLYGGFKQVDADLKEDTYKFNAEYNLFTLGMVHNF